MNVIDEVLQKEIKQNKAFSKEFISFVKDRNKDYHLYDDFLSSNQVAIENGKVLSKIRLGVIIPLCTSILLMIGISLGFFFIAYGEMVWEVVYSIVMGGLFLISLFLISRLQYLSKPKFLDLLGKDDPWVIRVKIEMGVSYKEICECLQDVL